MLFLWHIPDSNKKINKDRDKEFDKKTDNDTLKDRQNNDI